MIKINYKTVKMIAKITLSVILFAGSLLVFGVNIASISHKNVIKAIVAEGSGIKQTVTTTRTNKNNLPAHKNSYYMVRNNAYTPYLFTLSFASTLPKDNGQDPETDITPPPIGYPVVSLDMSGNQSKNNLLSKNDSKYTPDVNALAKKEYPLKYSIPTSTGGATPPLVLIVHTHGTECYLPEGYTTYDDSTPTRTNDVKNNVVSVGKVFADILNENGIATIHCETMFDEQSYSQSYDLSEKAVVEYIKQYPSIRYVFDIHRDSVMGENKEKIKSRATINDSPCAQAMFVVGTDSSGAYHPDWMNNLTIASIFQAALVEKYPSLMRPINIRSASFNAEHAPGSILIEIGTCGNTLSEAQTCAGLVADTIANVIKTDGGT